MKYTKIIIKGRIPSKKNCLTIAGSGKKKWITPSSKYTNWEKEQIGFIRASLPNLTTLNPPYKIDIKFYAPDYHEADLSNKLESIQDMLVTCKLLEDDNWFVLGDIHPRFIAVDSENPRAEVEIWSEVNEEFTTWTQPAIREKSLTYNGKSVE